MRNEDRYEPAAKHIIIRNGQGFTFMFGVCMHKIYCVVITILVLVCTRTG